MTTATRTETSRLLSDEGMDEASGRLDYVTVLPDSLRSWLAEARPLAERVDPEFAATVVANHLLARVLLRYSEINAVLHRSGVEDVYSAALDIARQYLAETTA